MYTQAAEFEIRAKKAVEVEELIRETNLELAEVERDGKYVYFFTKEMKVLVFPRLTKILS